VDLKLQNRTALVTGSSAGIGWAIARELAAEGCQVILNGRSVTGTEAAADRIRNELPEARLMAVAADLGTAQGCEQILSRIPAVDILVNNLGIFDPRPFEAIDDAEWLRFFEINVMSGMRLSRALLPTMKARGWGRIIFISSESGICPPAEMVHYGMTKSAQLSIARGLAETCAGTDITVNSVLPGPTKTEGVTEFFAKLAKESGQSWEEAVQAFFQTARPTSLLKRLIEPREVATLVAYLCSPLSAATNGAALRVDGGVVRSLL
jgi:NAD(P)-dependent dehydrogenase (short-subunit alcohol dehydrogenase family)